MSLPSCISSYSYIKPQRGNASGCGWGSCISSYSYIKPQPFLILCQNLHVVYHPIPTSNHNGDSYIVYEDDVVYHPIPTSNHNSNKELLQFVCVVYHPIPTSNHNSLAYPATGWVVVYHPIPTSNHNKVQKAVSDYMLYIILFLHQTTTSWLLVHFLLGCISSYSYIKPQPRLTIVLNFSSLLVSYILRSGLLVRFVAAKILKKFQLQRFCWHFFLLFLSPKVYYITILLICHAQDTNHPCFWDDAFHPLDMYSLTFLRCTVADIDGEL